MQKCLSQTPVSLSRKKKKTQQKAAIADYNLDVDYEHGRSDPDLEAV